MSAGKSRLEETEVPVLQAPRAAGATVRVRVLRAALNILLMVTIDAMIIFITHLVHVSIFYVLIHFSLTSR